jgi:hypothetical protein
MESGRGRGLRYSRDGDGEARSRLLTALAITSPMEAGADAGGVRYSDWTDCLLPPCLWAWSRAWKAASRGCWEPGGGGGER